LPVDAGAYLWVFDHAYFAVTDDDGRFHIRFAPAGNPRLVVWEEDMGFKGGRDGRWGEAIQVPNGKVDLGDIKLKPPTDRSPRAGPPNRLLSSPT
jgi:hypothetical protein